MVEQAGFVEGADLIKDLGLTEGAELDAMFHALAHGTRRRMLDALAEGPRTVGGLAAPFAISLAAASKHVRTLEAAGLIRREVRGTAHLCHLAAAPMGAAAGWLDGFERYWSGWPEPLLLEPADRVTAPDPQSP